MSNEYWEMAFERALENIMDEMNLEWDEAHTELEKRLNSDPGYLHPADLYDPECYEEV